jgi:MFS family permease
MSGTDWRRILVLASVVGFLEALLFSVLAPLLPDLEEALGLSKASAGLLTSAYAAGAFIGALPSIWAARRFGVKATVLAGLILLAVSSAAFTVPESAWLVFAARIGQGAGSAFAYTGALAWLAALAPPARRGELIGVTFAATFSGELVGPLLGAVAAWAGLALVFSIVAALAVLIAAVAAAIPRPPRAERLAAPLLRALVSNRVVDVAAWLIALTALLLGVLGVLAPLRLDELGWGPGAIGAVFAIAALLQAASNPGVGRVADARGHTALLRAGLIVSAAASALLVLDERALVYAAIVVAAAVAYATLWTPALALLSRTLEREGFDEAFGFGLMSALWPPGFAIGAAAGGALAGATRDAWPYLLSAALCLFSVRLLGLTAPRVSTSELETR